MSVEAGDLSSEDAERFASELKPSWEFDEAPFTAGAAGPVADALHDLGGGSVNAEVAAALQPDLGRAIPPSVLVSAPAGGITRPSAQDQYRSRPPRALGAIEMAPAASQQQHRPVVARPARSSSSAVSRGPSSTRDDLLAIKKSNKGILFAAIGVAGGLALIFGIRAATSSSTPESVSSAQAIQALAAPTSRQEEPRIPPPPPASEVTSTPATASPTIPPPATTPPATTPIPTPAPEVTAQPARTPVVPPRAAPEPRQPARSPIAPPIARAPEPRPTHPVASPKPPPKPAGGIVRDNPF